MMPVTSQRDNVTSCPVCGGQSFYLDSIDANRSCEDHKGAVFTPAGRLFDYHSCQVCGFVFAPSFRSWSDDDFSKLIYNGDYSKVDPDCIDVRPKANANMLLKAFSLPANVAHLDYGGGTGRLCELLTVAGWRSSSVDPYSSHAQSTPPDGQRFGLITAFEVFEHVVDPHALIKDIKRFLDNPGLIVFSTLLNDGEITQGGKLNWWYAAPRNGHISLFSRESLFHLARQHGLYFYSFSRDLHFMWTTLPAWAAHVFPAIGKPIQGNPMEENLLRARVQSHPDDHATWHSLGLLYFNAGNLSLAIQMIEAAIAVNPKVALYHRNLGEMCRRAGQLDKGVVAGKRAVKLAPTDLDAHYNLGLAHTDAKDYKKAIESYRRALKLNPRHNLSWNNLGSALEQLGDKSGALEAYERAVAIEPRHAEAQNNAGAIYSEQGKLDQARAAFESAIAARPDFVESHYNLSSLKKYTKDDAHLAMLTAVFAQRQTLTAHARIRYCFALGKALDDVGEYDQAFAAYEEGNRRQHALLPCDETRADALVEAIIQVFSPAFFAARNALNVAVDRNKTPIFIVGMPRSGTTLLEQILCSHASVFGAGELIDLNEVVVQATGATAGKPFTAGVSILGEADLKRLGDAYLKRVWKLSPDSRFITDKMPANFFYLGLIHLALPHAKIIHAMRDPMDSCFSCFSRLFNDTMEFAYDQVTLGRYYARYIRLMQHWHQVLPPGSILDLPYESMIADTEGQSRRVLEFVGLPWDPACLEFYKNDRLVKTASVAQVRKPIYKSSVARWKHFARHLRPLYELVQDFCTSNEVPAALLASSPVTAPVGPRAETLHVQGIAHYRAGRIDQALSCYEQALAMLPDFPAALNSKGFALQDQDRTEEALACFARAVELAPEMAMARLNLGMVQLKLGDWERGWENYEARWTGSAEAGTGTLNRPACPLPQWHGETDTQEKRLLVITEQGFGDTFQFARYLPLAAERFAKVGFVCSLPTQRLMEWAYGDSGQAIVTFTRMPADFSAWDYQSPLMSLPRAFGTRPESIPATMPVLRAPEKASSHWGERLAIAAPARFRVGLAWAGRKAHQYDVRRSLAFEQLAPLLADERITWVSLQKWAPEDARPAIPAAHQLHQQGIAAWQAGQAAQALRLIHQAVSLDGKVALFHSNLAEMNRQQGRIDAAIQHGEQAVALDPGLASAHSNLGIAYYDAKDYDRAAACHRRALDLSPHLLQSLNNLGSIARARKELGDAADWYRQALAINGDFLESLSNLGAVLVEDDQADAAEPSLARALQLQPAYPEALCNLGLVRLKQERTEEAVALLQRSLQLRAGYPEALVGLARALHEQDRLDEAAQCLHEATQCAPEKPDAWCHLGTVRTELGDTTAAEAAYARALEIDPHCTDALTGLGNLRLEEGKIDESTRLLEDALAIDPYNLGARFHLTQARKVKPGDANLVALEAKAADLTLLSTDKRISLHYALGKAYDDLKSWDQAFPHFLEGARLKRQKIAYDGERDAARARRIAEVVDRSFIERLQGAGDPSAVPVFVLGMPRSGTTLTEQIIASHPEVFGAGELRDLLQVVQAGPEPYPDNLTTLLRETVTAWGVDYVARLRKRAPQARRITDKMPANYLALGLIPLILPNAKIIHVKRNPVDTCVSCFTRLFNRHQDATYDLHELGRHYANYARLMQHWHAVLPPATFIEVHYEDIVADMEGQARRLIDFVGLEWNDACLEFHKTKRNIRTASVTQVRQPIYTSSVERWRHYERYLGPLLEGLGAFAP